MVKIDGSQGEGGGQILRSSLALSLATGKPFTIEHVRARRRKPGLRRQHLASVEAARAFGSARVEGAKVGSTCVTFEPGPIRPGEHELSIGSAGSTGLVLQAVLPALLTASGPVGLSIEGGTHNPWAPPFEFLERVYLPALERMGARVDLVLERAGFYPAGGGAIRALVEPVERLVPVLLLELGELIDLRATILLAHLPAHIAERERDVLRGALGLKEFECEIRSPRESAGPGNAILVEMVFEGGTEIVSAFGKKGRAAEAVAQEVVGLAREFLAREVPVGSHLADQLLLPMALARGGAFVTGPPTPHFKTNVETIRAFLDVEVETWPRDDGSVEVRVRRVRAED